jgi:H2-forming N5,N10-methylenetetrahydromethanopterin dehydrogenase-like enzyme
MALRSHGEEYGIVFYKTGATPAKITAESPVGALAIAITYLRHGYHVLLTDPTVEALKTQDLEPDIRRLDQIRQARR